MPLSSGESDFYGIATAATMGAGAKGLLSDLGIDRGINAEVQVNAHSRSARTIASRRGSESIRRIDVREQWVQDRVAKLNLIIIKAEGYMDIANTPTKHADRSDKQGSEGGLNDTNYALICGYRQVHIALGLRLSTRLVK